MNKKFLLLTTVLMMSSSLLFGSVVINEVMPKNVTSSVDNNYQFSGWAELYNSGAEPVDVSLYFFSDTSLVPDKWQMVPDSKHPEKSVIQPGGFLVVYFDGAEKPTPFHASFKLPAKKGGLYLFDEAGLLVDRIIYDTTYRNISYGHLEDGAKENVYFLNPTKGTSNNGTKTSDRQTAEPSFDLTPGFYAEEQSVNISSPDASAEIYYTLDGSEPTKKKGKLYEGTLHLTKNTPLRAAAYRDDEIPSNVVTATYFIGERNINLPVVSVVSDPDYVTGDELGLFVEGDNGAVVPSYCSAQEREANYMNDWDRAANMEYFDMGKEERLNQELKIGNFGACSRTKFVKSIKVNANKVYGDKELDYPIFSEKPRLRWKSVVLRNSGNDFGRSYLRDGFMQTVVSHLNLDHQAYEPSVVFMNGVYYGMLNIRERTNKSFIFSNYGLDEDEFYLNDGASAKEGTTFDEVMSLARYSVAEINTPQTFRKIDEMIDLDEFLNYFMAEIYSSNRDWPGGNMKEWKKKGNGKWRWILYDTDFGLSLYEDNYRVRSIATLANQNDLFSALLDNDEVRARFLAKWCVHLATTFNPQRMNAILDSLTARIDQEARVYERYLSDNHKVEGKYDDNIKKIRQFIDSRVPYVQNDIMRSYKCDTAPIHIFSDTEKSTFILNKELIDMNDFSGCFFTNTKCELEAVAPAGFVFDYWEVTRNGNVVKLYDALLCDTASAESYKAYFKEDASYDPNENKILINEICTKNGVYVDDYRQQEDWIELYNSGKTDVDLAGLYLSCDQDTLDMYQFPSNDVNITTISAGGYKIIWADKDPEQGPLHADFKLPFTEEKTIFLSQKVDGKFVILDSVTYCLHEKHQSYARIVERDSVYWSITNNVTFAERNLPPTAVPVVFSNDFSIFVYPNPVTDRLFISSASDETFSVSVLSLEGVLVAEGLLKSGESVSLDSLGKGLYLVRVDGSMGAVVARVVKR